MAIPGLAHRTLIGEAVTEIPGEALEVPAGGREADRLRERTVDGLADRPGAEDGPSLREELVVEVDRGATHWPNIHQDVLADIKKRFRSAGGLNASSRSPP